MTRKKINVWYNETDNTAGGNNAGKRAFEAVKKQTKTTICGL
jgi:hypothetical protein